MCTLWKTIDILKQAEGRILTGSHSVDQANLKHAMSLRLVLNLWLSSCLSFAGAEDYRCELPHIFLFFKKMIFKFTLCYHHQSLESTL